MRTDTLISIMLVAMVSMPGTASADGPGYSFVEAAFVHADPDVLSPSDGFRLVGSFALGDRIHLEANHITITDAGDRYTFSTLSFGWNHPLNARTDVVSRLGFVREDTNLDTSGSDTGWMVQVGGRSMITGAFEFNGAVKYMKIDGDDIPGAGFGMRYSFHDNFSVGLDFEYFEDLTILSSGLRFNF